MLQDISAEEGVKRREEGAVGSFASCGSNEKQSRERSRALGKRRAGRRGLHFGKLGPGAAKDCKAGGELEMGISIRKRAGSYKGVMKSVLNRHKK